MGDSSRVPSLELSDDPLLSPSSLQLPHTVSAFSPFPSLSSFPLHHQQLLALLSVQLQSSLPIPSATVRAEISLPIKEEEEEEEREDNLERERDEKKERDLKGKDDVSNPLNQPPRPPSESASSTRSSPRKRPHQADKTSEEYLDRRRKNNDSARRSRELRRLREQENRSKMQVLEAENMQLRSQIGSLRLELSKLQLLLLGSTSLTPPSSKGNSSAK